MSAGDPATGAGSGPHRQGPAGHGGVVASAALTLVLIAAAAALAAIRNAGAISPDLLAAWMAGLNFRRGEFDAIYPAAGPVFEMLPPASWVTELRAAGHAASIFPFIYPPLWAWIAGWLTEITDYPTLVRIGNLVNPALLGAALWLAARTCGLGHRAPLFVGIGLLAMSSTAISLVALDQNQPQVLVAFLCVLAVERTRAGAPCAGGAALALAASIKVYPVLFVLFWLVRGEWRMVTAFAAVGGCLGGASIAVAGWPLHAEFLSQLRSISGSVVVTHLNYSYDPVIARLFFGDSLYLVKDLHPLNPDGWNVMAKPPLWKALNLAVLAAALAGLCRLARCRAGDDVLFWPLAFLVVALISPLTWCYHYIAALAFLPALLLRITFAAAVLAGLAILLPTSGIYITSDPDLIPLRTFGGLFGVLSMALYAGLLLAAATERLPSGRRALAPA